ncbi:MAG TPA: acyl carrier protein [Rhizomicrobium sp.]|jgi:acyl carrier protein|nr:acyl carrier protein [Rhizomicrobium sp.]
MARTEAEIRDWCTAYLAKMLERDDIDPDAPFARIGLDSAMALYFTADLEAWVGIELWPEVAFEHPSVAALSGYLAKNQKG